MIRAGSTWASPNDRMPGVSMIQPSSSGSARATADDEVCRPRPVTSLTTPVARRARGTRALTSVLLPTPEWPTSTLTRPDERLTQRVEAVGGAVVSGRDEVTHRQRGVLLEEGRRVGEVGLGEHEQGLHAGVVGGDQAAVDQPGARLGVGQGGDDDELVGVGHEDPLDRVGVVGGAPQHRTARRHPHDAGQAAVGAGRVADEEDVVADDDALAAELAGPHGDDDVAGLAVADEGRVPTAVDTGHPTGHGILVGGAVLASRTGSPAAGANSYIGLVVGARRSCHQAPAVTRPLSMRSHSCVNSGIVLATVPTSSTTSPGTTSPSTAAAMTMRWSA